jgi:hypothetical protein
VRKNTIIPIESYDPRLKQLLLDGSVKRIEIPCESHSQRISLRNQLLNYRARARELKMDGVAQLYRAKITASESRDDAPYLLVIAPRGSEFDSILDKASESSAVPATAGGDPLDDLPTEEEKQ